MERENTTQNERITKLETELAAHRQEHTLLRENFRFLACNGPERLVRRFKEGGL